MRSFVAACMALGISLGTQVEIASAVDLGVVGRALVISDRFSVGAAKVTFVTKDPLISKGSGTDATDLDAELQVSYDATAGIFLMPQGVNWVANSDRVAAYNGDPAASVRLSRVKPGKLIKVKARSLGDTPIDISTPPTGAVLVVYRITNGAETVRHCASFPSCEHHADTGSFKLVCRHNSVPAVCP